MVASRVLWAGLRCVLFFFQAEDGIRDLIVTGVQMCALPIFDAWPDRVPAARSCFHWFAEWGRDSMIALPGLCLATHRFSDAKRILRRWLRASNGGLIDRESVVWGKRVDLRGRRVRKKKEARA